MKMTTWATIAAAGLLLGTQAGAQDINAKGGLLGKRYAGADFAYTDYKGTTIDDAQGGAAVVNIPLSANYDFGASYDYTYVSGHNQSVSENSLRLSMLAYNRSEYGKAFLAGSLGHGWDRVKSTGTSSDENGMIWSARIGLEIPYNDQTAVTCSIGYSDAFNSNTTRSARWEYRLEGSYWLSKHIAGLLAVTYHQIKDSPDAAQYTVGVRLGF